MTITSWAHLECEMTQPDSPSPSSSGLTCICLKRFRSRVAKSSLKERNISPLIKVITYEIANIKYGDALEIEINNGGNHNKIEFIKFSN
jgi:hypothetical protein